MNSKSSLKTLLYSDDWDLEFIEFRRNDKVRISFFRKFGKPGKRNDIRNDYTEEYANRIFKKWLGYEVSKHHSVRY